MVVNLSSGPPLVVVPWFLGTTRFFKGFSGTTRFLRMTDVNFENINGISIDYAFSKRFCDCKHYFAH